MKKQSHKSDRGGIEQINEFSSRVNEIIAEEVCKETRGYIERINELEDMCKKLQEENDKLQAGPYKYSYIKKLEYRNEKLEEENRKQKLHIEAKDKAFMDLLKDYEDLKKERDEMKAEIGQRLDAFRNRYLGF